MMDRVKILLTTVVWYYDVSVAVFLTIKHIFFLLRNKEFSFGWAGWMVNERDMCINFGSFWKRLKFWFFCFDSNICIFENSWPYKRIFHKIFHSKLFIMFAWELNLLGLKIKVFSLKNLIFFISKLNVNKHHEKAVLILCVWQ